jgi:Holliday junction resolvase
MRSRGRKLRGRDRELDVVDLLRDAGTIAYRIAHGPADVIALGDERPALIQVKSTAGGPYERFTPRARRALIDEAVLAGADAVLAWWPPGRDTPAWIHAVEWPALRAVV